MIDRYIGVHPQHRRRKTTAIENTVSDYHNDDTIYKRTSCDLYGFYEISGHNMRQYNARQRTQIRSHAYRYQLNVLNCLQCKSCRNFSISMAINSHNSNTTESERCAKTNKLETRQKSTSHSKAWNRFSYFNDWMLDRNLLIKSTPKKNVPRKKPMTKERRKKVITQNIICWLCITQTNI